jgi:hypothetical protein
LQSSKSKKVYDTLDTLPIFNWIKCHEDATTKYCLRLDDYSRAHETTNSRVAFEKCSGEYLELFGLTSEFKEYLEAKKRVMLKKLDAYLKEDRSLLTIVRIEEKEIFNKYESNIKEVDYWEMVASLEQAMNTTIDVHKMSTKLFYKHLNLQVEKNKKLAKWQRK